MPLFTLTTNQAVDSKLTICKGLSQLVASILGKPESYVMLVLRDEQAMTFAGTDQPTALLQLKSLSLSEDQTTELSEHLCASVSELLKIKPERIYIEFASPPRHFWGWNKQTFQTDTD